MKPRRAEDANNTAPARQERAGRGARDAAVSAILAVTSHGKSIGAALEQAHRDRELSGRDRAFAAHLMRTTLRRYRSLLATVDTFMPRGRPSNAGPLNAILAAATAQLLLLRVAPHAVISIAVDQTQAHRRSRNYKGLVNAVLRKVAASGTDVLAGFDPVEIDIPAWLRERWTSHYGADATNSIAQACLKPAMLDITARDDPTRVAAALGGQLLATGTIRCPTGQNVEELSGFANGDWWVQDAAAALPARLIGARPDEHILDVCAAPGGKTMQLASTGARVTALEKDEARTARIRANLERVGLTATVVAADATEFSIDHPVDRILLDVPCSATGTIRRHPDILHNKRPTDISANRDVQSALIDRAVAMLKSGGTLVYCSCSLEPEEGQDQIASALARHSTMRRDPIRTGEAAIPATWITEHGDLRTRPDFSVPVTSDHTHPDIGGAGLDGFFAARLTKT